MTATFVLGLLSATSFLAAYPVSDLVKMDHFGYRPQAAKLAYFTRDPGKGVEIRSAKDDSVALVVTDIRDMGKDTTQPPIHGDHVWQADFSALKQPGRYRVVSPKLKIQSYDFELRQGLYSAPMAGSLKALYYQRCGTGKPESFGGVWHDEAACHMADKKCKPLCPQLRDDGELELSGGWHDAGDYEKKIGFFKDCINENYGDQGETLWYLLTAYELNPGLFPDGQSKIPESGNGIPDILDEAKWELDWYLKMQRPDGHVLAGIKVKDLSKFKTPPSADDNPRLYVPPTPRAEAIFVANCAHAARIFERFPATKAYAQILAVAAAKTWKLHVSRAEAEDFRFWAAAEWLRFDPDNNVARRAVESYKKWPTNWMNFMNVMDYGIFAYLQTPGADPKIVAGMKSDLGVRVDDAFKFNNSYNSGMRDWYYSYGANRPKMEHGMALWFSAKFGATGSHSVAETIAHAEDFLHDMHGANPMAMTYLTNTESLGVKHCIWNPWSMWFQGPLYSGKPAKVVDPLYPYVRADSKPSRFGPPPGYVTSGPNSGYSGKSSPPLLPWGTKPAAAKSYRDYFDGAGKSWEVNEVGIYFTSSYMFLASVFADADTTAAAPSQP